ncbi:MAG: anthranilate synthase component I [Verrucomicrobia bacterium]|nr:anthranilate synthase component I [Verrucomicrobiota bacterium]
MSLVPDQATFRELARSADIVPVCLDLMADLETPVSVYARLRSLGASFLFESVTGGEHIGRYSFCGAAPLLTITAWEDRTEVTHRDGKKENLPTPQDPLELIKKQVSGLRVAKVPGLPPFVGGMVGMVGYEYIHRIEPSVPCPPKDPAGTPLLHFSLVDRLVAFDNARQTLRLIVNARISSPDKADEAFAIAKNELEKLRQVVTGPRTAVAAELPSSADFAQGKANINQADFEAAVKRTQEYIKAGDCVQVVLSRRTDVPFQGEPLDLYRVLRQVNPSPYMFVIETKLGFDVVGASPEVNVRLTGRRCEIRPIAGTRPRGLDETADRKMEVELLADPKERSEHLMLVDLARNDLGRVCIPGSVSVPDYAIVERYSHVMHIVSQVEGELAKQHDAFDLFRATFPAGTLSGAPKIRAMQIISELEGERRGIYGGAVGYFGFDGAHDSCIVIRTASLRKGVASVQAGAGVVADSVPHLEFEETINKSKSVLRALGLASGLKS